MQTDTRLASVESAEPAAPELVKSGCPKWMSRWVWQILILICGGVTILAGAIMLVAPGPGMLVIYAGVGILATEFIWARQAFAWLRDRAKEVIAWVRARFKRGDNSDTV